mmetsp:Transcript_39526/g.77754  ORF Transcript_39526/g.77754 Transcript_39526/m.77754 type:complete len:138 (-) Transcript_39526:169-582(-)
MRLGALVYRDIQVEDVWQTDPFHHVLAVPGRVRGVRISGFIQLHSRFKDCSGLAQRLLRAQFTIPFPRIPPVLFPRLETLFQKWLELGGCLCPHRSPGNFSVGDINSGSDVQPLVPCRLRVGPGLSLDHFDRLAQAL